MKIRKGDNVLVISWKDKWQTSTVLKVLTKTSKIVVDKVNLVTRHYKKSWATPWQKVQKENPIDISNVMLVCPFTKKPTRVWFVFIEDKGVSKKFRFSKTALKANWWEAKSYIIK